MSKFFCIPKMLYQQKWHTKIFERHPILACNHNIAKSFVHNNFFKREASWWLLMKSFATCANFEIKGRSLKMSFRSTPKILAGRKSTIANPINKWNQVHYLVHQTNSDADKSSRIFFFPRKFFVPNDWWRSEGFMQVQDECLG